MRREWGVNEVKTTSVYFIDRCTICTRRFTVQAYSAAGGPQQQADEECRPAKRKVPPWHLISQGPWP